MIRIDQYDPPSVDDLLRLKENLDFTSPQMADLAGLTRGSQWRKYTGHTEKRTLGMHMHFYMAALLTLPEEQLQAVFGKMREQGAIVEEGPLPAGPRP